jgi:hypothetical protein
MEMTPSKLFSPEIRKPLLVLALLSLFLYLVPHAVAWRDTGSLSWAQTGDDVLYAGYGARAMNRRAWTVQDAAIADGGRVMYPWLIVMPGVILSRLLGLGPFDVLFSWRLIAALGMAAGFFFLFRQLKFSPWAAVLASLFLISDVNVLNHFLGWRQFKYAGPVLAQAYLFDSVGLYYWLHFFCRIITPGLNLPFLLFFLTVCLRAREKEQTTSWAAGALLGTLFYVYFYFWTTAVGAVCLLALFDARHRKLYLSTLAIGLSLGLPALAWDFWVRSSLPKDWMERVSLFLWLNRVVSWREWVLGLGLFSALAWLAHRLGRLQLWKPLFAAYLGSFLLCHLRDLTGLEIHNYHWTYAAQFLAAILMCALAYHGLVVRISGRAAVRWGLVGFLGLHYLVAVGVRVAEAREGSRRDTMASLDLGSLREFEKFRAANPASKLPPFLAIGGERDFQEWSLIYDDVAPLFVRAMHISPAVTAGEYEERNAFNAWLAGLTAEEYLTERERILRDEAVFFGETIGTFVETRLNRERETFFKMSARAAELLGKYRIRYVVRKKERPRPNVPGFAFLPMPAAKTWNLWQVSP